MGSYALCAGRKASNWLDDSFGCRSFILYYRVFPYKITDNFPFHQIKLPQKCTATQKVCPRGPNRKHSDRLPPSRSTNIPAARHKPPGRTG